MSVGDVLRDIPWDLLARGAAAGVRAIRRARSIRQAEDLVAALERIGEVPLIDLDRIIERVLRTDPQPPLDAGD